MDILSGEEERRAARSWPFDHLQSTEPRQNKTRLSYHRHHHCHHCHEKERQREYMAPFSHQLYDLPWGKMVESIKATYSTSVCL